MRPKRACSFLTQVMTAYIALALYSCIPAGFLNGQTKAASGHSYVRTYAHCYTPGVSAAPAVDYLKPTAVGNLQWVP